MLSFDANSVGVTVPFSFPELAPGWYMFSCRDAFVTLTQRNSRVGLDAAGEQPRSWRMGPATRVLVHVIYRTRFDVAVTAVMVGTTVDQITGLQSAGTAAPQIALSEYSTQDAQDTRSGWLAYDDGSSPMAARPEIVNGDSAICWVPGWARRGEIRASGAGVLIDLVNGATGASMANVAAAANLHTFTALDPWIGFEITSVLGVTAWVSWVDQ